MFGKYNLRLFLFGWAIHSMKACTKVNVTCSEIKTTDGYRYVTTSESEAIEMEVSDKGINIARASIEDQTFSISDAVSKIDNSSVTLRQCSNITMTRRLIKGDNIEDMCEDFIILDEKNTEALTSLSPWNPLSIVGIIFLAVTLPLFVVLCHYIVWRRKRQRNGKDASFPAYAKQLCRSRRGTYEITEVGINHQGVADVENRVNAQQEHLLNCNGVDGGVEGVSIKMEDMTKTSGDEGAPQVCAVIPLEGQNGNMGHDPGGGNTNRKRCSNNLCLNGGTLGGQRSDKDKVEQSPHSQRSAGPGFEERTGEEDPMLENSSGPCSDHITLQLDEEKGATTE